MSDLFGHDHTERPYIASDLLRAYDTAYRKHYHVPPLIVRKKDGPLAARLLKHYEFEKLYDWLSLYFQMPEPFFQQRGHGFGIFAACIDQVIAYAHRVRAANDARIERQPHTRTTLDIHDQLAADWRLTEEEIKERFGRLLL